MLRISPHLYVSTLRGSRLRDGDGAADESKPTVAFQGGISLSYYQFFLSNARSNLQGDLDLKLTILPDRPFSLEITESFTRTVRPFTEQVGERALNFARNTNQVGIDGVFSTRGQVLSGRVGYNFGYSFFDGGEFQFANTMSHTGNASAAWRFLPQTALVWDLNVNYRQFPNREESASTLVSDGTTLKTRVGVNGAITNTLSASALVGYAAGMYSQGGDAQDFIAQGEVRWQFLPNGRVNLGYDRSLFASYIGNYYRQDRVYTNAQMMFLGRLMMGAELSLGFVSYGTPVLRSDPTQPLGSNPDGTVDRDDIRLVGSLFAEYRFIDWLGVNATFQYTGDFTDYRYIITDATTISFDPANYQKFEGWLGVRAFF